MCTKAEIEEAFTTLMDAMTASPAPKPHGTKTHWMEAAIRAARISRSNANWKALSEEPKDCSSIMRHLTTAADAVERADYESANDVKSTLATIGAALSNVERMIADAIPVVERPAAHDVS